MNHSLHDNILETYQQSPSWSQSFSVQHDDIMVDLSNACLVAGVSQLCAPAQPKNLPNGLIYRFNTCFSGKAGWKSLKKMSRASLPGSDFIETRCCCALSLNNFRYTLHCNRYKCVETNVEKEFHSEAFTQTGVRSESVKRTKTKGSMSTNRCYGYKDRTESNKESDHRIFFQSIMHKKIVSNETSNKIPEI